MRQRKPKVLYHKIREAKESRATLHIMVYCKSQ